MIRVNQTFCGSPITALPKFR